MDLSVAIGPLHLSNPLIAASGCFGYGVEYSDVVDLSSLGGIAVKGLFLAVATFAFANAVHGILFRREYFGWLLPESVERPVLFLLDFEDERSMYFLCLGALVVVVLATTALRRPLKAKPSRLSVSLEGVLAEAKVEAR